MHYCKAIPSELPDSNMEVIFLPFWPSSSKKDIKKELRLSARTTLDVNLEALRNEISAIFNDNVWEQHPTCKPMWIHALLR